MPAGGRLEEAELKRAASPADDPRVIAETFTWRAADGWSPAAPTPDGRASLVLLMGDRGVIDTAAELGLDPLGELAAAWDGHGLLGWSTDGQAIGGVVHDDALVATVVRFDATRVRSATAALRTAGSARRAGRDVAETLAEPDLRVVMVAADGVLMNGSAIAAGITDVLPDVQVVGVLAADGSRYERAWTLVAGAAEPGHVCAVGLYGDQLEIAHGAGAGWTPVGPERLATNTMGNVIHELDGQTATELYRDYLGPLADDLVGEQFDAAAGGPRPGRPRDRAIAPTVPRRRVGGDVGRRPARGHRPAAARCRRPTSPTTPPSRRRPPTSTTPGSASS